MKYKLLTVSTGLALLGLVSCKKSGSSSGSHATVYVSGSVYNASNVLETYGVYWKNGVADTIPGIYTLNSVVVSGNDLYLLDPSGWLLNGVPYTIQDNAQEMKAIAVSGSDVYIAGSSPASLSTATAAAIYWKNGVEVDLTKDTTNIFGAMTNGIAISGTDVYVCAYLNNNAVYWKNSQLYYLPDGYQAKSIAVSGSDVYVAGESLNSGDVYWKNGVEVKLGANFTSTSIAISGSDVYVAGYTGGQMQACYMKNGTLVNLAGGYIATGIAVIGSDVYACGNAGAYGDGYAVVWKNGVVDTLGVGSASGIAIAP